MEAMETWPSTFFARLTDPIMERNEKQGGRLYVVGRNRTNFNRSIFGWKEFQIIVGPTGPSIFRKRRL